MACGDAPAASNCVRFATSCCETVTAAIGSSVEITGAPGRRDLRSAEQNGHATGLRRAGNWLRYLAPVPAQSHSGTGPVELPRPHSLPAESRWRGLRVQPANPRGSAAELRIHTRQVETARPARHRRHPRHLAAQGAPTWNRPAVDGAQSVIVNAMSEINIDAALGRGEATLDRVEEQLVEMTNGCICCALPEDLLREVARLADEDRFDHLLMESTGISEPLPVAETVAFEDKESRSLGDFAEIDTMVTVVGASTLLREIGSTDGVWLAAQPDPAGKLSVACPVCHVGPAGGWWRNCRGPSAGGDRRADRAGLGRGGRGPAAGTPFPGGRGGVAAGGGSARLRRTPPCAQRAGATAPVSAYQSRRSSTARTLPSALV
jgi:hypothetical protein